MHIFGQLWPRFNICDLMRKWWVNEIKLQNSTLYLKEKLCKPISRKKICPEYLQNSQMVLSMLCNDGKICEKKIVWVISVQMYPKILLSHPIFFRQRAHWNFAKVVIILSVISTVSCSTERSLSDLWRPKTDQKYYGVGSPQSSGTVMYLTCLCQQSRYWGSDWWVFIKKSLFKVLFSTEFYTKIR